MNLYCYVGNNPINRIDPMGNDYLQEAGPTNRGKIYWVITDATGGVIERIPIGEAKGDWIKLRPYFGGWEGNFQKASLYIGTHNSFSGKSREELQESISELFAKFTRKRNHLICIRAGKNEKLPPEAWEGHAWITEVDPETSEDIRTWGFWWDNPALAQNWEKEPTDWKTYAERCVLISEFDYQSKFRPTIQSWSSKSYNLLLNRSCLTFAVDVFAQFGESFGYPFLYSPAELIKDITATNGGASTNMSTILKEYESDN